MSWDSVQSLVREFNLQVDTTDIDSIRAELRRHQAELHPDKTGGSFRSQTDEERFHRLSKAIEYLDGKLPVPVVLSGIQRHLVTLEKSIQDLQRVRSVPSEAVRPGPSFDDLRRENVQRFVASRIRSGVFAATCGTILTFSGLLKDNPVFGAIADSPALSGALALTFLASGAIFVLSWLREYRSSRRVQWLMSDSGIVSVVGLCIHRNSSTESEPTSAYITRRALVDQIVIGNRPWASNRVRRLWRSVTAPHISHSVAEKIASMYIDELIRRGAISRHGLRGLEPLYLMEARIADELRKDQIYTYWEDYF